MNCPQCPGDVEMLYIKEDNMYHCPICNGQWWPPDKPERGEYKKAICDISSPEALIFGLAESTYGINYKAPLPPGEPSYKGGSRSGKRRKKRPKPQITNINYW